MYQRKSLEHTCWVLDICHSSIIFLFLFLFPINFIFLTIWHTYAKERKISDSTNILTYVWKEVISIRLLVAINNRLVKSFITNLLTKFISLLLFYFFFHFSMLPCCYYYSNVYPLQIYWLQAVYINFVFSCCWYFKHHCRKDDFVRFFLDRILVLRKGMSKESWESKTRHLFST